MSMSSPRLVGWMPAIGRREPVAQLVGAVLIPEGQELPDTAMYLMYLADRVQMMLEREHDQKQALRELVYRLESEGMLGAMPRTDNLKEAGQVVVLENPALQMRLSSMGVPGSKLPKKIHGGNPAAKKLVEETSLWAWTSTVLDRPHNALR